MLRTQMTVTIAGEAVGGRARLVEGDEISARSTRSPMREGHARGYARYHVSLHAMFSSGFRPRSARRTATYP